MTPDDLAAIRARAEAASEDIGITYSVPADEWAITSDKPTMQMLRHSRADINALLAEVDQLRAAGPWTQHVEKMRAMKQERDGDCICDRNPETTDGPDEECPWHGRRYSEWIERGNVLAAKIERVEALATECEGQHGQCWNSILGQRIRAALADPSDRTTPV